MGHIVLAFFKEQTADKIRRMLDISGFSVFAVAHSAADTIRIVNELDDALVITGFKLPDATVNDLFADMPRSAALIALLKPEESGYIDDREIFILPLPTSAVRLAGAVELQMGGWQRKARRKPKPRTGEEQKLIEQAKLLLMEQNSLSEEEAHRFIQKKSMDNGVRFAETAKMILGME